MEIMLKIEFLVSPADPDICLLDPVVSSPAITCLKVSKQPHKHMKTINTLGGVNLIDKAGIVLYFFKQILYPTYLSRVCDENQSWNPH